MTPALAVLTFSLIGLPVDDARLSTADLPAYLDALESSDQRAEPVGFRDLWEHPDRYRGHRVRVRGAIVRRFAQPAFGAFPPLTELWLRTPEDNPICLVYPTPSDVENAPVKVGGRVVFEGTFLRRIRYQGGDGPRLAPLVVGGSPPHRIGKLEKATETVRLPRWAYWTAGVSVMACLGLLMAWLHLQRPMPVRGSRDELPFLEEEAKPKNRDGTTRI